MRGIGVLLGVMLAVVTVACQSGTASQHVGQRVAFGSGSYWNISAVELKTMLEHQDFALVDVHVPHEGSLAQTDTRIAYDQIAQHLSELPADRNAPIVLYCRSGRMSQIAAETLVPLGYTNIWNLKDGMIGWQDAGYELVRD